MTTLQSNQATPEELAKVARYLGHEDCIPLATALGLPPLYITKLRRSPITGDTPQAILGEWTAANASQATKQVLCYALEKINRRDLAEEITPQRLSEGEMMLTGCSLGHSFLTFGPEFHMYTCMHAFARLIASHHTVKVHDVTAKHCELIDERQSPE